MKDVNSHQVGGTHYQSGYQHWDWAIDMSIGPIEYAASKYISRWWKKHGPIKGVEDLQKAKHYIEKIKSAHSVGNYPAGIDRINSYAMCVSKTFAFGNANGMTERESMMCLKLAVWETPNDLDEIMLTLDSLIRDPQKAAGGRGGVALA